MSVITEPSNVRFGLPVISSLLTRSFPHQGLNVEVDTYKHAVLGLYITLIHYLSVDVLYSSEFELCCPVLIHRCFQSFSVKGLCGVYQ
jgi:hypothetical protein